MALLHFFHWRGIQEMPPRHQQWGAAGWGLSTGGGRSALCWEAMFGSVLRDLSEFPN